jgi:two-component system capsular synthesis sensor histidine kinase RcsC
MRTQSLDDLVRALALCDPPNVVVKQAGGPHGPVKEIRGMANKSKLKILVADDNRLVLTTVCRMLKALGCDATGTSDGLEALSRFEREDFDLVLTDLQMPHMDGWGLASRIKSLAPGIPVIAMTGMGRKEVLDRPGKSAVDRVLYKPMNLNQLDQAVAAALESRPLENRHK